MNNTWDIQPPEFIEGEDCMANSFSYWRIWAKNKETGEYKCGCDDTPEKALLQLKINIKEE